MLAQTSRIGCRKEYWETDLIFDHGNDNAYSTGITTTSVVRSLPQSCLAAEIRQSEYE